MYHLTWKPNWTAGLERVHGYSFGDSLDDNRKNKWQDFGAKLMKVCYAGAMQILWSGY